jgi:hypothetical protein
MRGPFRVLLLAAVFTAPGFAASAWAQDSGKQIEAIQAQINQLQRELTRIKGDLVARDRQVKAAQADAAQARASAERAVRQAAAQPGPPQRAAPPPPGFNPIAPPQAAVASAAEAPSKPGRFHLGGVTVTFGGFLAAEGVYRTRNNVSDIGSSFNTLPLAQNPNYHTGEFRGSGRQTRISLLAEGQIAPDQQIAGYYETDFLGVGTTSNSTESNSYVPRLRQAYLTYDNSTLGWHVLAGQAWSLLTISKTGMVPRQENIPLTIDSQYVPGFTWKRQWHPGSPRI